MRHTRTYRKQRRKPASLRGSLLRESLIGRSWLSTSFRSPRDTPSEAGRRVATSKRGRADKVFPPRLICREANSCYSLERVKFARRRAMDSRIKADFRDLVIASLRTRLSISSLPCRSSPSLAALPIGFRSTREEAGRKVKRDKVAGIPPFVGIARPLASLYLYPPSLPPSLRCAVLPLSSRDPPDSLPILPLSNVYGRGGRSRLKRRLARFISVVRLRPGSAVR